MVEVRHRVFVGLGNVGKRYVKTRHNIGFMVVERLVERHHWELKEVSRFRAKVAKGIADQTTVHVLEPTTFMNASGQALRRYLDYFHLSFRDVCVVTDDVALPFGEMRLRAQGSSGGHNGLKSIEQHLRSRQYARLRMGIAGQGSREGLLEDYVLEDFSKTEQEKLPEFVDRGAFALEQLIKDDIELVMKTVNTRVTKVPEPGQEKKEDESNNTKPL